MRRKMTILLLTLAAALSCMAPACAMEYNFDGANDYLFGRPTSDDTIKAEAAQILKRLQAPAEPNSPNGTHYMAQVSPDFIVRAKTKDHDRLMAMLPFSTLTLSTLDGYRGVFALIHRDEARNRPLHLRSPRGRKPSINRLCGQANHFFILGVAQHLYAPVGQQFLTEGFPFCGKEDHPVRLVVDGGNIADLRRAIHVHRGKGQYAHIF